MIKRRLSLSSLIVGALSDPRHSRHHHRRRGCCRLMAISSSSSSSSLIIGNNDPLVFFSRNSNKGFHLLSSAALKLKPPITPTTHRFQCLSLHKTAAGNDNNNKNTNINTNTNTNTNTDSNSNTSSYKAWPRAFAPCLPHLLHRDSDKINGQSGAYHTIGFPNPPLPEKLIVAVDVDEVLGNFISALNRFIADRYSLNHSVSEYHVYEFFKIWNCSRNEADIRVHEFFKTSYFKTGIHPIPGAWQALQKLSRFCNLSVVTSRQNAIKDHTIEWIEKHFPGLFQEIHFGNHFALDGQSRPKSDICRSLGAKVLIDDNPRYAVECAEVGIKVLLFDYENSYPWCKTEYVTQHPLVIKVHNWEEVEHQLVSQIVS